MDKTSSLGLIHGMNDIVDFTGINCKYDDSITSQKKDFEEIENAWKELGNIFSLALVEYIKEKNVIKKKKAFLKA